MEIGQVKALYGCEDTAASRGKTMVVLRLYLLLRAWIPGLYMDCCLSFTGGFGLHSAWEVGTCAVSARLRP